MKVFGGIHERAQKYFLTTLKMFQMKSNKESEFVYYSKDENDTTWRFELVLKRNFVSRVYKLSVSCLFSEYSQYDSLPANLSWNFQKKEWISKGKDTSYCKLLNQHKQIKKIVQSVDYESIEMQKVGDYYQITMVPIPGSYVFILLPPLQYFIKIKQEEVKKIKELAYKVEAIMKDYQKKTAG